MDSETKPTWKRWFGSGAWIALVIFIGGRLALEPARSIPQFDDGGMDPFGSVEKFRLQKSKVQSEVVALGSSVPLWGMMPDVIAEGLNIDPAKSLALGVAGGTPFDMWTMVERNQERFADLKIAILEVNPMIFHQTLEGDARVDYNLCQRATLAERLSINEPHERAILAAEWVLPTQSVRRSLRSLFLNVADLRPGDPIYPNSDKRVFPSAGWTVNPNSTTPHSLRTTLKPEVAARRLVGKWIVSDLQESAMRKLIQWMEVHHVLVVLHQFPVHHDVVTEIQKNPAHLKSYAEYTKFVNSLGIPPEAVFQHLELTDCGVAKEGMRDHTHLNQLGATQYCTNLAGKIKALQTSPSK
jgi:hypothetical protein